MSLYLCVGVNASNNTYEGDFEGWSSGAIHLVILRFCRPELASKLWGSACLPVFPSPRLQCHMAFVHGILSFNSGL